MFDFAFSELMVICVVALVVLGPTRLPGVVRKVGRWIGKARAMARDFRQQLENEVTLDELNRMTEAQSRRAQSPPPAPGAPESPEAPAAHAGADPSTAEPTAADPVAASGYPYGVPTDTSGMSSSMASAADPSTVTDPSDDTFSHAHAEGEAPAPWSPEPDAPAAPTETAAASDGDTAADESRRV